MVAQKLRTIRFFQGETVSPKSYRSGPHFEKTEVFKFSGKCNSYTLQWVIFAQNNCNFLFQSQEI